MHLRTQRLIDNYVGGMAIAVLRPATMLLGALLRRNHELTVGREVVWVKMLGGGSLVLAMPMLLGLRRAHPNVRMVLVTTRAVQPFAELLGVFDEYRIIDTSSVFALLWTSLTTLARTFRADCIVDLEVHSRLTTVFATLTMARNRVAFWLDHIFWRRGLASHLVFFNRASGAYHFYDRIADLFGVAIASQAECEEALARASGVRGGSRRDAGQVCIGFACSDLAHERMLSPEQWVLAFRDNLRPEHRTFVLLGAPGDRAHGDEIIADLARAFPSLEFRNACGDSSLAQSVTVLFAAGEFWGIDSSLLHLARTSGMRCVSYWGPTDPATLTRPSWAVAERQHYRKVACSPCVHTSESPPCHGDNRCIKALFDDSAVPPLNWTPLNWTPMEHPPRRAGYRVLPKTALAAAWRNIGFICVAVVLVYCLIHAFDPPRLNWGDSGSDYNVMESGRNFARYGFLKLRLTPFLMDPQYITSIDRQFVYTHYPQLPDLMNGLERRVLGLSTITQFRFVSLIFAFSSLAFLYLLVREYWGTSTAQFALALWVVNPLWIQHADYLHHIPYLLFFGLGCFWFLDRYLRGGQRRFLWLSGVFVFFTFLSSYDYWFFAPLVVTMMTLHRRGLGWPAVRTLSLLGAFAVLAMGFKFGTNIWARGGFAPFLADLRFQYRERGTSDIMHADLRAAAWPTFRGRVDRQFTLLFYPMAAFWLVFPLVRRRLRQRWPLLPSSVPNPWWLALAALPFLYVFVDMWVGQMYPGLLVLPFVVIGTGALATVLLAADNRGVRVIGGMFVLAILGNSLYENFTFRKSVVPLATISALRADLDRVSTPGQYVVANHVFDGFYHYYFNRNLWEMIVVPPNAMAGLFTRYERQPQQTRTAGPDGVIYVQHKRVADQLFDKSVYPILAQLRLWEPWANPNLYRSVIDQAIRDRDRDATEVVVALHGRKVAETNDYIIWSLPYIAPAAPLQGDSSLER